MMKCKFCGYSNCKIKKTVHSPHNQNLYNLYYCEKCSNLFFDKDQFPIVLKNLYNELSLSRGNYPEAFTPSYKWKKQVSIIKNLIPSPPQNILDVGCRTGDFLMHFNSEIKREGIELSKYYSTICKKRGITVHEGTLQNIKLEYKFDVVTCYAILEHIEYPNEFLNKLKSLIKKEGLLVILIPTYECLKRKWKDLTGSLWHMYSPPEHLNFFSRKYLDSYLNNNGFKLIHRYYTSGGMINPFPKIMIFNKSFRKIIELFDNSWLNKLPVFDHMYSYYIFEKN